jgi:hypothetical protein
VLTKLLLPCSHPNSTPERGREKTNRYTCAQECQLLDTAKTPTIAKKIHRQGPAHPGLPATCGDGCGLPPLPLPSINVLRVHRKGGRATGHRIRPRQTGSLVPEGMLPCTSPAPSPTSHLEPDPALVSQLLTQGYSPQNKTLLWSLNSSFKIFYSFGFNINFSLQIITLVVPYGTVIGPKCPLNALL